MRNLDIPHHFCGKYDIGKMISIKILDLNKLDKNKGNISIIITKLLAKYLINISDVGKLISINRCLQLVSIVVYKERINGQEPLYKFIVVFTYSVGRMTNI